MNHESSFRAISYCECVCVCLFVVCLFPWRFPFNCRTWGVVPLFKQQCWFRFFFCPAVLDSCGRIRAFFLDSRIHRFLPVMALRLWWNLPAQGMHRLRIVDGEQLIQVVKHRLQGMHQPLLCHGCPLHQDTEDVVSTVETPPHSSQHLTDWDVVKGPVLSYIYTNLYTKPIVCSRASQP